MTTIQLKTIAEINALGVTLEDTAIERSILWYSLKDSNTLNFKGKSATFVKKFFATADLFALLPMASFKKVVDGKLEKTKVFQFRATGSEDMTALCADQGFDSIVAMFELNFDSFDAFNDSLDAFLANLNADKKAERETLKAEKADRFAAFEAASPTNTKEKFDMLEKQAKAIESSIKAFENAELDTTDLFTLLDNIQAQLSGGVATPLVRETAQPEIQQA